MVDASIVTVAENHQIATILPVRANVAGLAGAPGRIRTCDARFRKPTLYPLSYEGFVVKTLTRYPDPTGSVPRRRRVRWRPRSRRQAEAMMKIMLPRNATWPST